MRRLIQVLVSATVVALSLVATGTTGASADPGTTVMGWTQLGLSNRIALVGYNQPSDVAVPVPQGVTPTLVTGQIGSVINVTAGRVDISDGQGNPLGTIAVPAGDSSVPFAVDTSRVQVTDGAIHLSFVLRGDDPRSNMSCAQSPSVTLTRLAVSFSGEAPNPVVVADFLPAYLETITIRVGPNPSLSQQQAALSLVAKLTRLYRPIPVRIDVDTSADPALPTSTGTSRIIEIRNGGQAAITVENGDTPAAVLVISGDGAALSRQIDLFSDRRILLAQSGSAAVTASSDQITGSTKTLTFAQLGIAGKTSVLGTTTLYAGFDASRFAVGSIQEAKVHLIAQYTAVESGAGSVLISSGNTVLASRVLDKTGNLDLTFNMPADSIASNIGLALELRYLPDRECPPTTDRITFALDPRSTIWVNPGPDNRGGFSALPMAFTPGFDVAVDRPDQIRYAARAINVIGQQTAAPLRPNVRPIDDAANSSDGLLIVATGDKLKQLGMNPPVLPLDGTSATIDGSPVTDADLGGPLGVIQTFSNNNRTVLAISTSGGNELVERSFDYILGMEGRWASLSGDVVATGAHGDTVNLTIRNSVPQRRPDAGAMWWLWITVASGAVALAAVAAILISRLRRRKHQS